MRKHQISLNELPQLINILEKENKETERLQTEQNALKFRDEHLISEYEEELAKNKKVIKKIDADYVRKEAFE